MDNVIGTINGISKSYSASEYASLKNQRKIPFDVRLQCQTCSATASFRRAYKREGKPETKACFAANHRNSCEFAVRHYHASHVPGKPTSPVLRIKLAGSENATTQVQTPDASRVSSTAGRTTRTSGNRTRRAITQLKELLNLLRQPSFDRFSTYLEYLGNSPMPVAECVFPLTRLGSDQRGTVIGCWGRVVGTGTGKNKKSAWLHSGLDGSGFPQIAIRNPDVATKVLAAARRENFDFATSMHVIAFGEIRTSSQSVYCDVLHETDIAFLKALD